MNVEAQAVEMYSFVRGDGANHNRTSDQSGQPQSDQNEVHPEGLEEGEINTNPVNRVSPSRRLQRVVREVIREHYLCIVLVWLLLVLALAIATFVTFIEMLIVFRKHHNDKCDVPLDIFVWINICTFFYHNTLHLCIQRWLGYDPSMYNTDDPIPDAVARYEAFVQFWSFLLCISGVILVCEAKTCQDTAPELYQAVARFAWIGFALAIACVITSMSTAIFVLLVRQGALSTSNAAPTGTLEQCKVVTTGESASKEDKELLADDENGEPQTCPICMELFGEDKEVRLTPCKHVFHGPCLSGWLQVSRCCPMCRTDFCTPTTVSSHGRPGRSNGLGEERSPTSSPDAHEERNLLQSRMGAP